LYLLHCRKSQFAEFQQNKKISVTSPSLDFGHPSDSLSVADQVQNLIDSLVDCQVFSTTILCVNPKIIFMLSV